MASRAWPGNRDGKLIVGGYAMSVNGYPGTAYYLLRLDANGNVLVDNFMRSGAGGNVYGVWSYPPTDGSFPNQVRLFGTIPRLSDPTHTHVDHMHAPGRRRRHRAGEHRGRNR